jgi:hypothetical protein
VRPVGPYYTGIPLCTVQKCEGWSNDFLHCKFQDFSLDVRSLNFQLGAVFVELKSHLCNEIVQEFSFEFRDVCKKWHLIYNFISNIFSSPTVDITFDKLKVAKCV